MCEPTWVTRFYGHASINDNALHVFKKTLPNKSRFVDDIIVVTTGAATYSTTTTRCHGSCRQGARRNRTSQAGH
jgi:hypothetical protein